MCCTKRAHQAVQWHSSWRRGAQWLLVSVAKGSTAVLAAVISEAMLTYTINCSKSVWHRVCMQHFWVALLYHQGYPPEIHGVSTEDLEEHRHRAEQG